MSECQDGVDLLFNLLCSSLCNKSTTNRSNGVWALRSLTGRRSNAGQRIRFLNRLPWAALISCWSKRLMPLAHAQETYAKNVF